MAGTYKHVRSFQGRTALDLLSSHQTAGISEAALRQLKGSAEVGVLLGRVHHDMAQYVEAEQCFHSVLRHHPTTMEGMDVFSLVLFHLNRQERLSALAQELSSIDSDAVETHIAIGNLFSLNASPSIALRSFRRACLSAPGYAYSFTLAGHECLALNQPLKALRFFREAIRIDPRHWNGWSGIASILATEDKFDEARLAINRACSLNRFNSGLWEVMGLLNEQKEDYGVALGAYSEALAYNPKSSSACLRRAELLWKTGKFELAHSAFLQVVALLPSEPRAHLLLAESYMRKG
ncbi:TPR-like protein, partial [Microstroma glucosiphilum]